MKIFDVILDAFDRHLEKIVATILLLILVMGIPCVLGCADTPQGPEVPKISKKIKQASIFVYDDINRYDQVIHGARFVADDGTFVEVRYEILEYYNKLPPKDRMDFYIRSNQWKEGSPPKYELIDLEEPQTKELELSKEDYK